MTDAWEVVLNDDGEVEIIPFERPPGVYCGCGCPITFDEDGNCITCHDRGH